jgi:glutamine synthetase
MAFKTRFIPAILPTRICTTWSRRKTRKIPTVCHSLDMALDYLDKDRGFLKAGGVFTDDLIDAYIELKMKDVTRLRMTTHPIEIEMYYSL